MSLFGAAVLGASKSYRNGGINLVHLVQLVQLVHEIRHVCPFSPFFNTSARFLNARPSPPVCHLFYCSPCTSGDEIETPCWFVFTLIRPPSRISILLFVYRNLRVVLYMSHCLIIYILASSIVYC